MQRIKSMLNKPCKEYNENNSNTIIFLHPSFRLIYLNLLVTFIMIFEIPIKHKR